MERFLKSRLARACGFAIGTLFVLKASLTCSGATLTFFDGKLLGELAKAAGVPGNIAGLSRNVAGTALLITIKTNNQDYVIAVIGEHGTNLERVPKETAAVNQDGRPICSYEQGYFLFPDGTKLLHQPGAFIKFSAGGELCFISAADPAGRASIFRTNQLREPLVTLPQGFLPQELFQVGKEIIVFGQELSADGERSSTHGIVYSQQGSLVQQVRAVDLSRFGAVLDMDPDGELVLVDGKRDTFREWGIFNLRTGKYKSFGQVRGRRGLFLSEGLSQHVEKFRR